MDKTATIADYIKDNCLDDEIKDFALMYARLYKDTGTLGFAIQACSILEARSKDK